MTQGTGARGADGLTAEELAATRRGWWDDAFTERVVRALDASASGSPAAPPARILDVGCGLATAAHALLPRCPSVRYTGLDLDGERLRASTDALAAAGLSDRSTMLQALADALPCPDGAFDGALTSMTLQHVARADGCVAEIARVLAPGGRLVAIEPDNLANRFYFDGVLEPVNRAFGALLGVVRDLRRAPVSGASPAAPGAGGDVAIGPRVPALVEGAGLRVVECFPHAVGRMRRWAAGPFLDGIRRTARTVTAGVSEDVPATDRDATVTPELRPRTGAASAELPALLRAVLAAVDREEQRRGRDASGWACQLFPVFVCAARKA